MAMNKLINLIAAIILFFGSQAYSDQFSEDLIFILGHRSDTIKVTDEPDLKTSSISELNLLAGGIIKLYQQVISSQDLPACNFTPSCSRFTYQAIDRAGFIRGSLLGADRLMRCHWFSGRYRGQYYGLKRSDHDLKLYDPIERYIAPAGDE
jgi:putative component of membrane protein insertase Oxa1/YidC/SpoIIIJ protein YidD